MLGINFSEVNIWICKNREVLLHCKLHETAKSESFVDEETSFKEDSWETTLLSG